MRNPQLRRLAVPVGILILIPFLTVVRVAPEKIGIRQRLTADGPATVLGPGWHLRIPGLQTIELFPYPLIPVEGEITTATREGIPIRVPYRLSLRTRASSLAEAGRNQVRPEEAARSILEPALKAHIGGMDAPELFRSDGEDQLLQIAREALAGFPHDPRSLQVGPLEVPDGLAEALRERARIRELRDPSVRIILIGWDGADWGIIDPLIRAGKLPHLSRLKQEGAWGRMRSETPTLSPLLWTTVVTGKPPEEHGIIDFLVRDPQTDRYVPITQTFRKVKALWNIFTDCGLDSIFIAWWATWPAEPVRGLQVSDRVAYSLFPGLSREVPVQGLTYPEDLYREVREVMVSPSEISPAEVARFVDIDSRELDAALRAGPDNQGGSRYEHPVQHLRQILSSTQTYHRLALRFLEDRPLPNLFAIYYQGIDEVSHRFAHFLPPRMDTLVTDEEYSRYRDTVTRFYIYQDRLLGEILERIPSDAYLILLSDHGFAHGTQRPRNLTPAVEGRAGRWHTPNGIYIFRGPGVSPGRRKPATLYQITPTILSLAGLPAAEDLSGRPLEGTPNRQGDPQDRAPIRSYERLGTGPQADSGGPTASLDNALDQEILDNLRSLGYIEGPGERLPGEPVAGGQTSLYHSNLAVRWMLRGSQDLQAAHRLRNQGRDDEARVRQEQSEQNFAKARDNYRQALAIDPESAPALAGLSELAVREGNPDEGLRWARKVIEVGLDTDPEFYLWTGDLFIATGHSEDGRDFFRDLVSRLGEISEISVALGKQYSALGDPDEAERYYWAGLEQEPACLDCLQELFELLDAGGRIGELEGPLENALTLGARGIPVWNWLGLVRKRLGRFEAAETAFRTALEEAPDHAITLAHLGALYLETGRYQEAVVVLERGLEGEGRRMEVMVNLLLALGRVGRLEEAESRFRDLDERGIRDTRIFNAMAFSYLLNGLVGRAEETARRSLALAPEQPEVLALLESVREARKAAGGRSNVPGETGEQP